MTPVVGKTFYHFISVPYLPEERKEKESVEIIRMDDELQEITWDWACNVVGQGWVG